jgi:hypothetical protein
MLETATAKILETGLLGAIIVIEGLIIWYQYKRGNDQEDKHFGDMKEVWNNDVKWREEIKTMLNNFFELIKGVKK